MLLRAADERRGGARRHPASARPAAAALRRRLRGRVRAEGVRRPRAHARPPARAQRGIGRLRDPVPHPGPHVRALHGGAARVRDRRAEAEVHPPDAQGGGDLDAVPLRAERRLRRRGRAHHRGARRRRMGRERLQGLDDGRVVLRLRPVPAPHQLGRAQAPRPQRVHHPDPPGGHRAAPDRDDQRLQGVLPGVHDRRARPRLRPRRRRRPGLDRRHAVDVPREERDGRRFAVRHRLAALGPGGEPRPVRRPGPRHRAGRRRAHAGARR